MAVYSGNPPNTLGVTHNATCTDTAEDVTVTTVPSSMSTAQTWVPNDSATISAAAGTGDLAGTVSFTLYSTSDCSGPTLYGPVTRAVAGAASGVTVSTSNATAVSTSGNFSWKVSYASTNLAQRDIPASCHETSDLTIRNGGTVSSP